MASSGVSQCSSTEACKAPTSLYQMRLKLFTLSLDLGKKKEKKAKAQQSLKMELFVNSWKASRARVAGTFRDPLYAPALIQGEHFCDEGKHGFLCQVSSWPLCSDDCKDLPDNVLYNVSSFLPRFRLRPPALQHRPADCCQVLRIFSRSQPVLHFQIPKGEGFEIWFSVPRAILFHCHSALSFLQHCTQQKELAKATLTPDSTPAEDNNLSLILLVFCRQTLL